MNLPKFRLARPRLLFLILILLVAILAAWGGQRGSGGYGQPVAQITAGSPLPVFVVNDQAMPDDFVTGSYWRFTTWTVPNSMSWTARVQKVNGGWALLEVNGNGQSASGWYFIPQMPGRWQKQ